MVWRTGDLSGAPAHPRPESALSGREWMDGLEDFTSKSICNKLSENIQKNKIVGLS